MQTVNHATESKVAPIAVTRREAARLLSVSTRTIDLLASRGELQRIKFGRKTLFRRDDVLAFVERLAATN